MNASSNIDKVAGFHHLFVKHEKRKRQGFIFCSESPKFGNAFTNDENSFIFESFFSKLSRNASLQNKFFGTEAAETTECEGMNQKLHVLYKNSKI